MLISVGNPDGNLHVVVLFLTLHLNGNKQSKVDFFLLKKCTFFL